MTAAVDMLITDLLEDPFEALRDLVNCRNEDRRCFTVARVGEYWVDIVPMVFNHRVVLTPVDRPAGYAVGWCYPSMTAALLAVRAWNPAEADEPAGFTKRVGDIVDLRQETVDADRSD